LSWRSLRRASAALGSCRRASPGSAGRWPSSAAAVALAPARPSPVSPLLIQ